MTKQNELAIADENVFAPELVRETEDYIITKTLDGKYRKQMKYKKFYSFTPETDEEIKILYRVFNDANNSDLVTPMSNMIDQNITIEHVFFNPYESFDENTGENNLGVVSTIFDGSRYYSTSSKTAYHSLVNMFKHFLAPDDKDYKPITVKVLGIKQQNGIQIDLSIV